jgi:hypothetical protein
MNNAIKRKKVFVNRAIQGRILLRMVKYWLFYNLAVWHALLLVDFQRYGIPGLLGQGPRLSLLEFYAEFAAQHVTLLVLAVALFPVILWDMLKLTHQIAGPLVRFRNTLKKMASGDPVEKIQLRNGDLLIEFQEAFNELLDSNRLLVGQHPRSSDQSGVDSPDAAVLAAVTKLQTELISRDNENSSTTNSKATVG